jgi:UDP-N-acetylmuramoylalanine--D-glutamate ligase
MIIRVEMTEITRDTQIVRTINLHGMKVLVVGMARTGIAVARFLSDQGAKVTGTDIREKGDVEKDSPDMKNLDIELHTGGAGAECFLLVDLIIASPGVHLSIPPLVKARKRGIPIISEIELASWFVTTPLVAVTGTNGKTTTTQLIGDMLQKAGRRVFVGGNIGNPLINLATVDQQMDLAVVEVSSFQLEGIDGFRPTVGVLLNLTEDHLDRYSSFESYVEAKSRLFMNQRASDISVLNKGDPTVEQAASWCKARKVYYNIPQEGSEGAFFNGRHITMRGPEGEETYDPHKCKLMGVHNIENMMAAVVTARVCGCPRDPVQETLEAFPGLPHRLEFVKDVDGVRYFNDSKGTNVGAVVKSLQTFSDSVILIAGGKDKGGDYGPLREPILERAKHLILIGEARERMKRALRGAAPITLSNSLEAAVAHAHRLARVGDTVLLSPACSSFDMFRDYVERGDTFKTLVGKLEG